MDDTPPARSHGAKWPRISVRGTIALIVVAGIVGLAVIYREATILGALVFMAGAVSHHYFPDSKSDVNPPPPGP